jgi:hypothetical protein
VGSLPLTGAYHTGRAARNGIGLSTLQEYSRQRQRAAIESFLEAAEQRSEIEVEGRSLDLRGALERISPLKWKLSNGSRLLQPRHRCRRLLFSLK